jgi:hypothetical protein
MQRVDVFVLPTLPLPALPVEQTGKDIEIDGVIENATVAYLRVTIEGEEHTEETLKEALSLEDSLEAHISLAHFLRYTL